MGGNLQRPEHFLPLYRRQLIRDSADLYGDIGNSVKRIGGICGHHHTGLDDGFRAIHYICGAFGCQMHHLTGYNCNPLSFRAGPGRLHRGVEGQDMGLERNIFDILCDFCDLL